MYFGPATAINCMTRHRLSIVLPCYNPSPGWDERVISHLASLQEKLPDTRLEPVIVNDGSTIGVADWHFRHLEACIPGIRILSYPLNRGKGYALREGFREAEAPHMVFTDIDFPYLEEDFLRLYTKLREEGTDVLVGVRQPDYYRQTPWYRALISRMLKTFIALFLGVQENDTQGGLKGFSIKGRELLLETTVDRYLFDLELIRMASRRSDVLMDSLAVRLRPEVKFASLSWVILRRECWNLIKIIRSKKG